MLLKLTDSCDMNCIHCLSDCVPTENYMTWDSVKQSVEWIKRVGAHVVNVTGGEPTKHPEFLGIVKFLLKKFKHETVYVVIATNGEWILEHKDEARDLIRGKRCSWQITTDVRYYSRLINIDDPIWKEKGFELCVNPIQKVYPLGRALENNLGEEYKCSQCYNIRALCSDWGRCKDLETAISALEINHKYCQPQIKWNGEIALGESNLCPSIASIYDIFLSLL